MQQPLVIILLSLIFAYIGAEICKYLKVPRVVGQLLVGMLLGISVLKKIFFTPDITDIFSFLANIGMVLLFFFIGMNISMREFRKNIQEEVLVSVFNTGIPFALGIFAGHMLGFNLIVSFVIGVCLSVSAQAISLDILEELHFLKSKVGKLIITAGMVDEIFKLGLLSATIAFIYGMTVTTGVVSLVSGIIFFLLILVFFKLYVVPFLLQIFEEEKTEAGLFMAALIITILMASLSDFFGLGSLLGAIFAGIFVREILLQRGKRWEEHDISKTIHTISYGFFIPLFFVWVGLNLNLQSITANFSMIFIFTLIALFGTVIGSAIGVFLYERQFRKGITVGFGVSPKGDTELVVSLLAYQAKIISLEVFSALVFMAVSVTIISSLAFRRLVK